VIKRNKSALRVGVYAGSFDPPTVGHLWMIEQAAALFESFLARPAIYSIEFFRNKFEQPARKDLKRSICQQQSKKPPVS
jgi:pantetheine-phosphate adenylyltransferase